MVKQTTKIEMDNGIYKVMVSGPFGFICQGEHKTLAGAQSDAKNWI